MNIGLIIAIIVGVLGLIFIVAEMNKKAPEIKAVEDEIKRTNEATDEGIQLVVMNAHLKSIARSLDIIAGIMLLGAILSGTYFMLGLFSR